MGASQEFTWSTNDDVTELPKPRKDDRPAFSAEALGHFGSLRRLSLRLTRNRADADDLIQDAYLRAFRPSERFTPGDFDTTADRDRSVGESCGSLGRVAAGHTKSKQVLSFV
jgi:hypothetical protein